MIRETVKKIMAEVFELSADEIHDNASQRNLSVWDSLQHLNLVVEIEDKFNLSFEPEAIGEMTTLDKIVEQIKVQQL